MSNTVKLNTRFQNKHDIPANWANATFAPYAGELIVYDDHYFDDDGKKVVVADAVRFKIGDGVTPINDLPFVDRPIDQVYNSESINAQSGVAIKTVLSGKADKVHTHSQYLTSVPSEIYVGDGDMPESATVQFILDGDDDELAEESTSNQISAHNTSGSAHSDIREQINQLSSEKVDNSQLTEAVETALIDAKGIIVQEIIAELQGLPVFGVVDENNTITVTSQLSDGTYVLKYENNDGTTSEIGTIVVGTGTGGGTGGETDEPDTPATGYTNWIQESVNADESQYVGINGEDGYKVGYRINSSGVEVAQDGMCSTGFIPYNGETIRLKNVTIDGTKSAYLVLYNPDKTYWQVFDLSDSLTNDGNGIYTGKPAQWLPNIFIRITCGVIDNTTILTLNEEIV